MLPDNWPIEGAMVALSSAIASAVMLVALRPVLARYALARPNARSSHRVPTPQGGGIAIVAVTIAITTLAVIVSPPLAPVGRLAIVLAAAAVLAVVGAADDILVLRALPRLVCQLAASVAVVLALPDGARLFSAVPLFVERALLVVAIVWFVNLFNFMDGIDWITVAETLPLTAGIAAIAAFGHAPPIAFVVAIALAGATVGFAPFNRPVARLFLGDVGSLPMGLLLAWLLVLVAESGHLLAAVMLPLYYLADATITLVRRLVRGERVWEAHRSHFYQRATDRGFSVLAIVTHVFVVNLILVALALASVVVPGRSIQIACAAAGVVAVTGLLVTLHVGRR